MNRLSHSAHRIAGFALLLFVAIAGCKKSADTALQARLGSSIAVRVENDGVHVTTKTAEFLLTPTGSLRGRLRAEKNNASLSEPANGVEVIAAKAVVNDIVRDIAHAQIQGATGKLGVTGKRVEIEGRSAGTGLEETLFLEVYDDFPTLALLSASYKNTGTRERR